MIVVTIVIIWFAIGFLIGFLSGKIHERVAWNRLIDAGTIPRPRRRR